MTDKEFIAQIGPLIQKYSARYGYRVASPIIAQACIESGYGRSTLASKYHNYFGMKCGSGWTGRSVNMNTREEYTPGTLTTIRDNFRAYDNMEQGVIGYFEFIQYPRYANLKHATTPRQYLEYIKADGYATAYTYVNTCLRVVMTYNLTVYDDPEYREKGPIIVPVSYAGQVTTAALRVRMGPGTNYDMVHVGGREFLLPKGICVAFDAESDGWARLAGVNGWCSLAYIKR